MKIGFFTDAYFPTGFGVSSSIESFYQNLEKLNHEVFIFAPLFKNYKDENKNVIRFDSLKVFEKPETRLAAPFLPIESFEKTFNSSFDIIHSHSPFSMGFLGKYISNRKKIPFVYTHHTEYPEYAKIYLKEKILLPYIARALSVWFSNMSDAVIAPSFKIQKSLLENGVKKPIYLLPTGVNINIFKKSEEKTKLKKELKIPLDKKVLLFVGRISKEKNIDFLIKVFQEIQNSPFKEKIIFLIIGDGSYFKNLKELIKKSKIEKPTIITGFIPHKEIDKYYKVSDIFVFPSLTETQGIVILEAMASGLPVVALKDDAFKNIVINNKNGFLIDYKKEDAEKDFTQKIIKLLNNNNLFEELSKNATKTAHKYSDKNQTEKLVEIYKELILKNKVNLS
ncbi:MAG TPA: glycosyltransferase [Candidatus Pacearchaeota archaeon]|nr:glycosyltransferase [Candidatus Pacearchaeota archaeon]HPO68570.1 glycosyltransferase [Candidatus Pacearchaeota archaeon]